MTSEKSVFSKKAKASKIIALPSLAIPFLLIVLLVLILLNPVKVSASISTSLARCVRSLIPTLFPVSVLSSLIVSLGGVNLLDRTLGAPVSVLFGVSRSASSAILIGMLCGFPIGAVHARALYESSAISKDEYEKLIALSSMPSPAFILNVLGNGLQNSKLASLSLLVCVLLSNLTVSQLFRSKGEKTLSAQYTKPQRLGASLGKALSSAAGAMLNVIACVVFFSALSSLLPDRTLSVVKLILSGVLEFSQGCSNAVDAYGSSSLPVCAAFLSYGGLSVNFQIMSVCGDEISYKKYFIISSLRSFLSFLLSFAVKILLFDI